MDVFDTIVAAMSNGNKPLPETAKANDIEALFSGPRFTERKAINKREQLGLDVTRLTGDIAAIYQKCHDPNFLPNIKELDELSNNFHKAYNDLVVCNTLLVDKVAEPNKAEHIEWLKKYTTMYEVGSDQMRKMVNFLKKTHEETLGDEMHSLGDNHGDAVKAAGFDGTQGGGSNASDNGRDETDDPPADTQNADTNAEEDADQSIYEFVDNDGVLKYLDKDGIELDPQIAKERLAHKQLLEQNEAERNAAAVLAAAEEEERQANANLRRILEAEASIQSARERESGYIGAAQRRSLRAFQINEKAKAIAKRVAEQCKNDPNFQQKASQLLFDQTKAAEAAARAADQAARLRREDLTGQRVSYTSTHLEPTSIPNCTASDYTQGGRLRGALTQTTSMHSGLLASTGAATLPPPLPPPDPRRDTYLAARGHAQNMRASWLMEQNSSNTTPAGSGFQSILNTMRPNGGADGRDNGIGGNNGGDLAGGGNGGGDDGDDDLFLFNDDFRPNSRKSMRDNQTDEALHMMALYSSSLAANFDIHKIVERKFDGSDPERFVEFELLWRKADHQMVALKFPPAARFWELKKVLKGLALNYVDWLPPSQDSSYEKALETLVMIYRQEKSALRTMVNEFNLTLPKSNGTPASRMQLHCSIVSYKRACMATGASESDQLLAYELSAIERRLDDKWREDWNNWLSKKEDPTAPLGFRVTYEEVIRELHRMMIKQNRNYENTKRKAAANSATTPAAKKPATPAPKSAAASGAAKPQQPQSGGKSAASTPAAAAKRDSTQQVQAQVNAIPAGNKKKQQNQQRASAKCTLCKNGKGGQKFDHTFPANCPLVKYESENRLTDAQIREKVTNDNLCKNCFRAGHKADNCDSPSFIHCRIEGCKERHHAVFHDFQ